MHVGHDGQHEVTACPVASGVHGIVEKLLAKRGLSGTDLESFLDPSLKHIARAAELPGVSAAAEAILPFIRERRPIVVFGDYDCDGVCASAILVKTLRRLGACAEAFLPNRFTEGYGMTPQSVARLLDEHPDVALAVTVDCGITSEAEIRVLKDRGVAVVVTDHHLPPETLPMCDALVDPKIPAQRSSAEAIGALDLCGAGIAFFLASALVARATAEGLYDGEKFGAPLLVLAGLATRTAFSRPMRCVRSALRQLACRSSCFVRSGVRSSSRRATSAFSSGRASMPPAAWRPQRRRTIC